MSLQTSNFPGAGCAGPVQVRLVGSQGFGPLTKVDPADGEFLPGQVRLSCSFGLENLRACIMLGRAPVSAAGLVDPAVIASAAGGPAEADTSTLCSASRDHQPLVRLP